MQHVCMWQHPLAAVGHETEGHIYLIEKILNKKAYSFHLSWKYRNKKFLITCRHASNKGQV